MINRKNKMFKMFFKRELILTGMFGIIMSFSFAQNLPPVAVDDAYSVYVNSGANILDVQANDTDDGPLLTTSIVGGPSNGTVLVMNGDSLAYEPDSNFCGIDTIWYQVCDNGVPSLCDTGMVIINVDPRDSDGDGISDVYEMYYFDSDGDGVYDLVDIDSDNDGIPDAIESQSVLSCNVVVRDTDGDGVPDHLDLDSDNDGISDLVEAGYAAWDLNNDGILDDVSGIDYNFNGMPDALEALSARDTDGDGVMDAIDLDSDNDGIADIVESNNSSFDTNGDGFIGSADASSTDTDGDGILDVLDGFSGLGDGAGNQAISVFDKDGDGVINSMDLDSDNDGIADVVEGGNGSLDADNNGVMEGTDSDGDGIINVASLDGNSSFGANTGSQTLVAQDQDGDGVINSQDLDSDNDGVADVIEGGFYVWDATNDGVLDGALDTDGDGIINIGTIDANTSFGGNLGTQDEAAMDVDGDGVINSNDLDSDNDGIADVVEAGFGVLDSDNDGVLNGTDADADGIIDSGTLDNTVGFGGNPGAHWETLHDFDNDGIFDFYDLDADNDTIPDIWEREVGYLDANWDGMVDAADTDGDGIGDVAPLDLTASFGGSPGDQNQIAFDTDGDGFINSEDLDDDGDMLLDKDEWDWNQDGVFPDDCDLDNIYNFLDTDPCDLFIPQGFSPNGDGINDILEIDGLTVFPNNTLRIFNRWGTPVFEAAPYNNDFDGHSNMFGGVGNNLLPVGTYYYTFDKGNGTEPQAGFFYINH